MNVLAYRLLRACVAYLAVKDERCLVGRLGGGGEHGAQVDHVDVARELGLHGRKGVTEGVAGSVVLQPNEAEQRTQ